MIERPDVCRAVSGAIDALCRDSVRLAISIPGDVPREAKIALIRAFLMERARESVAAFGCDDLGQEHLMMLHQRSIDRHLGEWEAAEAPCPG